MTKESLGLYLIKLILTVSFIVVGGALLGTMAYSSVYPEFWTYSIVKPLVLENKINKIEVSADKKSPPTADQPGAEILNAETKAVIFTIADTQKYLKDSGYFYNPDTFQTTNAKYEGDCFLAAALSNNKDRIVFSTGCLPGDLSHAWVGIYERIYTDCSSKRNNFYGLIPSAYACVGNEQPVFGFRFLITGSGRNFVWSADDKTVTYEADLGLSGMTETRTIDAVTGEILEKNNTSIVSNIEIPGWVTYKNTKYQIEISYPSPWGNAEEQIEKGVIIDKYVTFGIRGSEWVNIRKFETKDGQLFKDILVENIYLGETDPEDNVHPSFSDFELKKVGSNNFYYIFPYLSEGQYSVSYWYVNGSTVIQTQLYAMAEGDWQDSSWKVENQSAYKIFNQILSTFKFIGPEK